jgi:hypothetical protein
MADNAVETELFLFPRNSDHAFSMKCRADGVLGFPSPCL